MDTYNRIIVIGMIVALAGWLAYLHMPPGDISAIIQAVALPAGIYVSIKGKRGGQ